MEFDNAETNGAMPDLVGADSVLKQEAGARTGPAT